MTTTENTDKTTKFIFNKFKSGELTNQSLVQIIELSGMLLNAVSITDYASRNKMSYNGVKNHRKTASLLGKQYVIEND